MTIGTDFPHRKNADLTSDAICPKCFQTITLNVEQGEGNLCIVKADKLSAAMVFAGREQPSLSADLLAEYASAASMIMDKEEREDVAQELWAATHRHPVAA